MVKQSSKKLSPILYQVRMIFKYEEPSYNFKNKYQMELPDTFIEH